MRRSVLVPIVAVLLLVRVHADDVLFGPFGDYLESLRTQAGIPGLSAAIVGDDGILWKRAFGQQDVERSIATRTDTPFHVDGLTEVFTSTLVLRCKEEGHFLLEDPIGKFKPDSPDANLTVQQILTHTSGAPDSLVFSYRPDRLEPLTLAVKTCRGESFRAAVASLLDRLGMFDSVPGPDAISLVPPDEGIPGSFYERYSRVLPRLAIPYAVDRRGGRTSPSRYAATTLTSVGGLISTVEDVAQFDLALRKGVLLQAATISAASQPPLGRDGQALPHGMGWFTQTYNGERIVWQYGVGENASSSLMVTVPARILGGRTVRTLILLANSDGLVKGYPLAAGDVTASPFGKLFLGAFVR